MSRGVEVAGFPFGPQSQTSHCSLGAVALLVSIDSFASSGYAGQPTGLTFGSLTHGLSLTCAFGIPCHSSRHDKRDTHEGVSLLSWSKWRDSNYFFGILCLKANSQNPVKSRHP